MGRPRKYQTDAEKSQAARRYRSTYYYKYAGIVVVENQERISQKLKAKYNAHNACPKPRSPPTLDVECSTKNVSRCQPPPTKSANITNTVETLNSIEDNLVSIINGSSRCYIESLYVVYVNSGEAHQYDHIYKALELAEQAERRMDVVKGQLSLGEGVEVCYNNTIGTRTQTMSRKVRSIIGALEDILCLAMEGADLTTEDIHFKSTDAIKMPPVPTACPNREMVLRRCDGPSTITMMTTEQKVWLLQRATEYMLVMDGGDRADRVGFFGRLTSEWQTYWPEKAVVFPRYPASQILTDAEQGRLTRALIARRHRLKAWLRWYRVRALESQRFVASIEPVSSPSTEELLVAIKGLSGMARIAFSRQLHRLKIIQMARRVKKTSATSKSKKEWTTVEQKAFLTGEMPGWIKCIPTKNYTNFMATLCTKWFAQFSERDVWFKDVPHDQELTDEQTQLLSTKIQSRKKQLKQWMRWHTNSSRQRSADRKTLSLVDELIDPKTRTKKEWEIYSKKYYDKVKQTVDEDLKTGDYATAGHKANAARLCIEKALAEESPEVKAEIRRLYEEGKEKKRSEKAANKRGKNTTSLAIAPVIDPMVVLQNRSECGAALQKVLTCMGLKTNYKFTVIMGGPDPFNKGEVVVGSFHTGETAWGSDFSMSYPEFDSTVLESYAEFLKDVFASQGSEGASQDGDVSEDDNVSDDEDAEDGDAEDTGHEDAGKRVGENVGLGNLHDAAPLYSPKTPVATLSTVPDVPDFLGGAPPNYTVATPTNNPIAIPPVTPVATPLVTRVATSPGAPIASGPGFPVWNAMPMGLGGVEESYLGLLTEKELVPTSPGSEWLPIMDTATGEYHWSGKSVESGQQYDNAKAFSVQDGGMGWQSGGMGGLNGMGWQNGGMAWQNGGMGWNGGGMGWQDGGIGWQSGGMGDQNWTHGPAGSNSGPQASFQGVAYGHQSDTFQGTNAHGRQGTVFQGANTYAHQAPNFQGANSQYIPSPHTSPRGGAPTHAALPGVGPHDNDTPDGQPGTTGTGPITTTQPNLDGCTKNPSPTQLQADVVNLPAASPKTPSSAGLEPSTSENGAATPGEGTIASLAEVDAAEPQEEPAGAGKPERRSGRKHVPTLLPQINNAIGGPGKGKENYPPKPESRGRRSNIQEAEDGVGAGSAVIIVHHSLYLAYSTPVHTRLLATLHGIQYNIFMGNISEATITVLKLDVEALPARVYTGRPK
ncbi:hypothetical protein BV22DRAFT_1051761 [Leucogyrophana mollusca]|uniref:Uncharacterized protein n=1 Tax=Leucogyrophana mollusca TaxID=85980 RepID=A0ACB8AYJ8_9AGAM|nr:hypothetical protein BV22DRAFT_1051761 [Leucogyrophana mollusca]